MPPLHRLLAVIVAVIWGLNFIAIHATIELLPPFFAVAVRFALIAVPTVLLIPRPRVPARYLIGYGLGFGVVQFVFLYAAMRMGMPAGLASLVLQSSAPFTVILGALILHERVSAQQWLGIAIAVAGMLLVGVSRAASAQLLPFLLVIIAALGWAVGNLASRQARPPNPLHLTLWMSAVVPIPLFLLSLVVEGPSAIGTALSGSGSATGRAAWAGMAYTVLIGTVVGSGIWTWLMARHQAGEVAPFSMLVPVTGLAAAAVFLGERPAPLELAGAAVVIAGVLIGAAGTGAARRPRYPGRARRSREDVGSVV